MDKIDWLDEGLKILNNFYKNYDYKRFRPFYHGTSSYHWESIKEGGLCPRGSKPSIWTSGLESPEDRIFFSQCSDSMPITASHGAIRQAKAMRELKSLSNDDFFRSFGRKKPDFSEKPKRIILRLDNFDNYIDKVERDTDILYLHEITDPKEEFNKPIYKQDLNSKILTDRLARDSSTFCHKRIEKEVVVVLDTLWLKCGWDCVREAIDKGIPDALKSLYSRPSSISMKNCSINPSDLTPFDTNEWELEMNKCWEQLEGGCDDKEKKLKSNYFSYLSDAETKKKEVEFFKNREEYRDSDLLKKLIKEKEISNQKAIKVRADLIDFINQKQVPIFKHLFKNN